MKSRIVKFMDFMKIQKFRCLKNETFFLQMKNSLIHIKAYFMAKKQFCSVGNL